MDVTSLVIGFSGLLAVADKALLVAQLISDIRYFGEDTTEILFQLANESQKIHSAIVHVAHHHDQLEAGNVQIEPESSQLVDEVRKRLNAAFTRLQFAFDDAEKILEKYGLLGWDTQTGKAAPVCLQEGILRPLAMLGLKEGSLGLGSVLEHKKRIAAVQHHMSLKKRVKFSVKPWSTPDKTMLQDAISRMKYWNAEVGSMLSAAEKRQIRNYTGCQIMATTDNADALVIVQSHSVEEDPDLQASAALGHKRIQIEEESELRTEYPIHASPYFKDWNLCEFNLTNVGQHDLVYLVDNPNQALNVATTARETAIVDWVNCSELTTAQKALALSRVEQLCQLLEFANKPGKLRTLSCLGYIEDIVRNRYGLLLRVPVSVSLSHPTTVTSISLYQILNMVSSKKRDRKIQNFRPSLSERYRLARRLTQTFMELHKVRWYHKGFDSSKILFFCSKSSTDPLPIVSFEESHVFGFELSRPWGRENISLPVTLTPGFDLYCHPDLRIDHPTNDDTSERPAVPRFKAAYDIYSLSATLLEIGLWQPLKKLIPTQAGSSRDVQETLVGIAEQNLAHTMGVKYCDAVVKGLRWAEESELGNGYMSQTNDEASVAMLDVQRLFWDIVKPLEECACGT